MNTAFLQKNPLEDLKCKNVFAIASGKGGVGKTWLSTTLATALARQNKSVLLFDGDLGLANVDIQLGIMPKRDLSAVIAKKATMSQVVHHFKEGRFDVIAGRSGSGVFANLPLRRLVEVRDELYAFTKGYDTVLMDLGAGLDRHMRLLSSYAGRFIVVTNAEPTALTDAYAFIKTAVYEDPSVHIDVIINMAETHREGEKTHATLARACHQFLKMTPNLLGVVRRDRHVSESIRAQTPILKKFPGSPAALDVLQIVKKMR